jgi:Tfp pilus assembly protein PilP
MLTQQNFKALVFLSCIQDNFLHPGMSSNKNISDDVQPVRQPTTETLTGYGLDSHGLYGTIVSNDGDVSA